MTVSVTGSPLPGAGVALLVHDQLAALERTGLLVGRLGRRFAGAGAAQHRLDPLDQQALREGLA